MGPVGDASLPIVWTRLRRRFPLIACCFFLCLFPRPSAVAAPDGKIPAHGPRTFVLEGERDAFRDFCQKGAAKDFYFQLKKEFDDQWLHAKPPAEPQEYGDPDPKKRTADKVDKWHAGQSACNQIAGAAEAATILWLVTNEPAYLQKAKEFLLAACQWSTGDPGATRIDYNDEAHFRLWRKLPFVYDQIRGELKPDERQRVLEMFRKRGGDSFDLIKKKTRDSLRNSIEEDAASHPIRFMSMTGLAGLALYDDLPEAREWLDYALGFYRKQFPPWGGDEGGWGEGNAYWRGNVEHSRFQDALVEIHHPDAYANPFWRQTGYFPLYFVQPYKHTSFGDTPNAGKFNLEPMVGQLELRLAERFQDGYLHAYANLQDKGERSLESQGLYFNDERYPAGMEYILRDWTARKEPLPAAKPLAELPPGRWFHDVGWVSMHSVLGQPDADIMLSFKSSAYGSFSHSHADQNAFILNAFGENLLINGGYREFHHSKHHVGYTETTLSKNAVLINGKGQKPQDRDATGKVLAYEANGRTMWTAADAAVAYNAGQPGGNVTEARRDIVMVDKRYFVVRDRVRLKTAGTVSWLLHAESKIQWDAATARATVVQPKARCEIALAAPHPGLKGEVTDQFPVPVDPKYVDKCPNQFHLTVTPADAGTEQIIYAVLWPAKNGSASGKPLKATLTAPDKLTVERPDGVIDVVSLSGDRPTLESVKK